jgi:hypothetical protein
MLKPLIKLHHFSFFALQPILMQCHFFNPLAHLMQQRLAVFMNLWQTLSDRLNIMTLMLSVYDTLRADRGTVAGEAIVTH